MFECDKLDRRGQSEPVRQPTSLRVVLAGPRVSLETDLVDLSATGARLRGSPLPSIGEKLNVAVGRIEASCIVRWRHGNEFGVQFDHPLLQADVIDVRRDVKDRSGVAPAYEAAFQDWVLGVVG